MASGPITSWQIDGETVADFIFWAPKSLQMVIPAMKLKDNIETCTLSYVKLIASWNLLYDAENPKLVLCDNLEGWERREEGWRFKREGICVCCCCCYVASVVSDSVRPHRRQSAIPGILQARTLEWVAISFSNA